MNKIKKIIKPILCVVASFAFVFCFLGCRAPITQGVYSCGLAECNKGDIVYKSANITQIDVHWIVGEVIVVCDASSDDISLIESGKTLTDDEKVHSFIEDGSINVYFWKSLHTAFVNSQDKNLTIKVPQNANLKLNIESVSGAITVENVDVANFKATTVSGSVKTEKIHAEQFECSTTSGKVSCLNTQCENAKLSSVSGQLELTEFDCSNLNASTVSGSLSIQLEKCEKAKLKTVSGNTKLILPQNGATVTFGSVSGKLKTDVPYSVVSEKRIFGGGACAIEFDSTSGNLNIE